jgi:hypothetical protein
MHAQSYANTPGYLIIIIGLTLSLISALVPHFEAGYRLMLSVFVAGMLPYMIYGIAVPLLRGPLTTFTGLVIVVAHAWLVFNERIIGHADYSDGMIYYGPMLLAILALPLLVIVFKRMGIP